MLNISDWMARKSRAASVKKATRQLYAVNCPSRNRFRKAGCPGGAVLLIAVMLGLGAYGGWYYLSSQGKTIADLVDPLPERLASYSTTASEGTAPRTLENAADAQAAEAEMDAPAPVISEQEPSVTVAPESAVEELPVEETAVSEAPVEELAPESVTDLAEAPAEPVEAPAVAEDVVEAVPEAAPVAEEAPVAAEVAEAPVEEQVAETPAAPAAEVASVPAAPEVDDAGGARVFGAVNVDSRVTISAVETSWVRIREEDGNVLLTRMLTAGDTYMVPNRDGLKLEVGNAGALTYSIDGAEAKPVGEYGAVISDFSLDVGDLTQTEETTVQ